MCHQSELDDTAAAEVAAMANAPAEPWQSLIGPAPRHGRASTARQRRFGPGRRERQRFALPGTAQPNAVRIHALAPLPYSWTLQQSQACAASSVRGLHPDRSLDFITRALQGFRGCRVTS